MSASVDVVIVGGGPAGLATALSVARLGRTAVAFDRARPGRFRAGETFGPELAQMLCRLGLEDALDVTPRRPYVNTLSAWGSPEAVERPSILNVYGEGVHVERAAFDRALMKAAIRAGVTVHRIRSRARISGGAGGWLVNGVRATLLVDASGRGGLRELGGWIPIDRMVGIGAIVQGAEPQAEMLIEASESGWWYTAPQPGKRTVALFMTDSDLIDAEGRDSLPDWWSARLKQAPLTAGRLAGMQPPSMVGVFRAESGWRPASSGDRWLAIGDASMAWDPLAGVGVVRAFKAGLEAAADANEMLCGATPAAGTTGIERYLMTRASYYSLEPRWPDSPFWARRQPADWQNERIRLDPEKLLYRPVLTDRRVFSLEALLPYKVVAKALELLSKGALPAHRLAGAIRDLAPLEDRRILVATQMLADLAEA